VIAGSSEEGRPHAGTPATFGLRLGAFVVDGALADLVAYVTGNRPGGGAYGLVAYLAFLAIELAFIALASQTPGMRVFGIAVVAAPPRSGRPALRWVRTALLATVVPALFADRAGRAWHDKAAGTVTVRTR
jgi:uncharacterized RDD family membrane protein YckC